MIKFRVNFIQMFHPQTYPHSEEFGIVIKDDEATTVDNEKELSLEQKLELATAKKIFNKPNYNTEKSTTVTQKSIGTHYQL
ncbi:hypothetical protein TNCV_188561 [Trichonephila clavipes]|nr:hypothetical protein TNCV_188561 [Trichonephila clavipes]